MPDDVLFDGDDCVVGVRNVSHDSTVVITRPAVRRKDEVCFCPQDGPYEDCLFIEE